MDKIRIVGGNQLSGQIAISGSKNSSLPIMVASLLTDQKIVLDNIPDLTDIKTLIRILKDLGSDISYSESDKQLSSIRQLNRRVNICSKNLVSNQANYEHLSKMRAGFLVIGPLLARTGYAKVSMPGGCAIGTRPVDIHLTGLRKLGAEITIEEGYVIAKAKNGLIGNLIKLSKPSVGATQNLIMAAVLAKGETSIVNASIEPETSDLISCIKKMGVQIEVRENNNILIQGTKNITGASHKIMADRIEAGTYAIAGCMTGGRLELTNFDPNLLEKPFEILRDIGCSIKVNKNSVIIEKLVSDLQPIKITTEPYPGFPTDLQAQFMALLTQVPGTSVINERIFENRFMHVQELVRMGANINLDGDKAIINGRTDLIGAPVMATDLRASVSLVLAALCARGETIINRVYHLDRGFEDLEKKISNCGGIIERIK
ncbi:MAG: UDP-N-acetylglucosamine 1-carboxyvinyltransferase [Hyphomicrobiales bacterium]|nr:UDP-N-acetylglucosamine 1-carboxyvinyltransferase [Hyphomicrobiales bacterium]